MSECEWLLVKNICRGYLNCFLHKQDKELTLLTTVFLNLPHIFLFLLSVAGNCMGYLESVWLREGPHVYLGGNPKFKKETACAAVSVHIYKPVLSVFYMLHARYLTLIIFNVKLLLCARDSSKILNKCPWRLVTNVTCMCICGPMLHVSILCIPA